MELMSNTIHKGWTAQGRNRTPMPPIPNHACPTASCQQGQPMRGPWPPESPVPGREWGEQHPGTEADPQRPGRGKSAEQEEQLQLLPLRARQRRVRRTRLLLLLPLLQRPGRPLAAVAAAAPAPAGAPA